MRDSEKKREKEQRLWNEKVELGSDETCLAILYKFSKRMGHNFIFSAQYCTLDNAT